jgi:glycerophosphoryl diester phosphodiesterase
MTIWAKRIALVLAIALLVLSFVNASWLAGPGRGSIKLIAHRGASQLFDHTALEQDSCTASRIEPPYHQFLENTLPGMDRAARTGGALIALDLAPTKDGKLAVFRDRSLECRTNGTGEVRAATMAELKALDAGHGYTADGGETFPFRGKGVGLIPELSQVLALFPAKPLLFRFSGTDPAEADLLAAALKAAGRDPVALGDGFHGGAEDGPVARIRQLLPKAWVFSQASAEACSSAYRAQGWIGLTPAECKDGTLMIPLNRQWAYAGWPNRLMARMAAVGARVIVTGPLSGPGRTGLDLPEQIGEIPASFTGYVWVEDIQTIGPALRPALNRRNQYREAELAAALEARRKRRE